jgi:hypothetical protein
VSTTTAAKERPILFSGPVIPAILEDQKTQTRRIIKPQPDEDGLAKVINGPWQDTDGRSYRCPYGKPGDILWVRETFCIENSKGVPGDPPFSDGRPIRHHDDEHWGPWWEQPHYRATDPAPELEIGTGEPGVKWRPSIFMPRWASRITLEIADVRVERLQSISGDDARAEGYDGSHAFPREWFALLWERINGPGSWEANPWVWAVEFRRVQP